MKKILMLIFVSLFVCSLSGNAFDFKEEILNYDREMVKTIKTLLTEAYIKNKKDALSIKGTKDYNIEWNESDNWNVGDSSFESWPVINAYDYMAYIFVDNPINVWLCSDSACNTRIAEVNLPLVDTGSVYMYMPPMPWVVDSEDSLGFLDASYMVPEATYTLTFVADKNAYYSNTGRVVNNKELFAINSGEYYIAIFWNGSGALVDKKKFTVNNSVAVKDYNSDKFNVSYNSGNITVNSQIAQNAYIKVFDINGKQVAATQLKGNSTTINMASKAKGIYIINIKGKDFNVSKKINVI